MTDYYEILGISKDATPDEIKRAYKDKARRYHPDKNRDNQKESEEMFKKVTEANEVLSDPQKREVYDKYGKEGLNDRGMGVDINDILKNIFGGMGGGMSSNMGGIFGNMFGRGGNSEESLDVPIGLTLEEYCNGCKKEVEINRTTLCIDCEGTGNIDKIDTTCSSCQGRGFTVQMRQMGFMVQQVQSMCTSCQGKSDKGKHKKCKKCNGNKSKSESCKVNVTIESGSMPGNFITIKGQGNETRNSSGEKIRGDVNVHLKVIPHEIFKIGINVAGKRKHV